MYQKMVGNLPRILLNYEVHISIVYNNFYYKRCFEDKLKKMGKLKNANLATTLVQIRLINACYNKHIQKWKANGSVAITFLQAGLQFFNHIAIWYFEL